MAKRLARAIYAALHGDQDSPFNWPGEVYGTAAASGAACAPAGWSAH
jgi:hypothetical protein